MTRTLTSLFNFTGMNYGCLCVHVFLLKAVDISVSLFSRISSSATGLFVAYRDDSDTPKTVTVA